MHTDIDPISQCANSSLFSFQILTVIKSVSSLHLGNDFRFIFTNCDNYERQKLYEEGKAGNTLNEF